MKFFPLCVCVVLSFFIFGCKQLKHDKEGHAKSVRFGVDNDPVVMGFAALFGSQKNVGHWICYYDGYGGDPEWRSFCILFDRYALTLAFDIKVNRTNKSFTRTSPVKLYLLEVTSVEVSKDQDIGISCKFGEQWVIEESQWLELVESGGDFDQIGIKLKKNSPVDGIDRVNQ
jgi:hypothetical protein